jgi:hypothetical protein
MEKISRRSFVKRTGAVTLGSVLGLGILPSVTRRLHATDLSQAIIKGVAFYWDTMQTSKDNVYGNGVMRIVVKLDTEAAKSGSITKGQCYLTGTVTIVREAFCTQTILGQACSGSARNVTTQSWSCKDGVPYCSGVTSENRSPELNKLMTASGEAMGTVFITTQNPGGSTGLNATAYATGKNAQGGDGGPIGAGVSGDAYSYYVGCCVIV